MHTTESEVSCSFLSSAALKEDEEGWGRGFGAVSGVEDVYAVRGDCSSATLHVQFKPLAPDPVVRNSVMLKCPVLFLPLSFFFFLTSDHWASNAT